MAKPVDPTDIVSKVQRSNNAEMAIFSLITCLAVIGLIIATSNQTTSQQEQSGVEIVSFLLVIGLAIIGLAITIANRTSRQQSIVATPEPGVKTPDIDGVELGEEQ